MPPWRSAPVQHSPSGSECVPAKPAVRCPARGGRVRARPAAAGASAAAWKHGRSCWLPLLVACPPLHARGSGLHARGSKLHARGFRPTAAGPEWCRGRCIRLSRRRWRSAALDGMQLTSHALAASATSMHWLKVPSRAPPYRNRRTKLAHADGPCALLWGTGPCLWKGGKRLKST